MDVPKGKTNGNHPGAELRSWLYSGKFRPQLRLRVCSGVFDLQLLAVAAFGASALVGSWHSERFRGRRYLSAAHPEAFKSGMACARAAASSRDEPADHGRGFLPLHHADRLDYAAARQGRTVIVPPS